ncbi:MAG: VanZ family protein [Muribaculaceae bacterium]|nr:VanZ family protein [Muribaculaceae bacterium]
MDGLKKVTFAERLHATFRRCPKWILTIVCLGVIGWLTLVPQPLGEEELPLFPGADKVAHGVMFFSLALCLFFDTLRSRGWRPLRLPLVAGLTLIAMLVGIGIECVQPSVGRGFEFWDMVADAFGAVLAGSLWTLIGGGLGITDGERQRLKPTATHPDSPDSSINKHDN